MKTPLKPASKEPRYGSWARWANFLGLMVGAGILTRTHPIPLISVTIFNTTPAQSSLIAVWIPVLASLLLMEVMLHFFADLNPSSEHPWSAILTFPIVTACLLFTLSEIGAVRKNELLPLDGAQASFAYWSQPLKLGTLVAISLVAMVFFYWLPTAGAKLASKETDFQESQPESNEDP